jgi:hypothetical protein
MDTGARRRAVARKCSNFRADNREVPEPLPPDLVALVRLARLLDQAVRVPGTSRRVGLDPVLGLVPGIGDVVSAVLSLAIVHGALRHRVPGRKIGRMLWNLVVDTVVGAVPLLGDLFDALFTANVMNVEILLDHRDETRPPRSGGEVAGVLALVALALFAVLGATLVGLALLVAWAVRSVS